MKPLVDRFSIVVYLDLMLNSRRIYAGNFLVRPREYIVKFLKKAGEACNFLRIAIYSNLDVFYDACRDINIDDQCFLPLFPSESKVWIVIYGEETISGVSNDRI